MSENWAKRERHTQQLISAVADHVLASANVTADQIYGLCQLTWLTRNHEVDDAPYIWSTKLPGLVSALGETVSEDSLDDAAREVADILGEPKAASWVRRHTGFTMFYAAYRKSVLGWIGSNRKAIVDIVRDARALTTDEQGEAIARKIEKLPPIPKANHPHLGMRPEYVMTPLVFSLDPRLRFPVVNGRDGVRKLLAKHKVKNATLVQQVRVMTALIGTPGVRDAADLDAACGGGYLHELATSGDTSGTVTPLLIKPTDDKTLPLKDEDDHVAIATGLEQTKRRLHNRMTNRLKALFANYTLIEGVDTRARFDVMLKKYNNDGDLLVEVKSSAEDAHVRMAIGQLYAYAHHISPGFELDLAIVLPERPANHLRALLDSLDIGCMWFDSEKLERLDTDDQALRHLVVS
jgi:hypothetical protein